MFKLGFGEYLTTFYQYCEGQHVQDCVSGADGEVHRDGAICDDVVADGATQG
jgi:hypothetical protein